MQPSHPMECIYNIYTPDDPQSVSWGMHQQQQQFLMMTYMPYSPRSRLSTQTPPAGSCSVW